MKNECVLCLPTDVDAIGGAIGGHGDGELEVETHTSHGSSGSSGVADSDESLFGPLFPQSLNPFYGNPFFNIFGQPGFGFDGPQTIPWWKG